MAVGPCGPRNARVMIVGEAPGENEVREGKPFVGYSGKLLDSLLAEAGINRADCFVTNVCRERPPKNDMGAWMPTTKTAQAECLAANYEVVAGRVVHPAVAAGCTALEEEINDVNPALIIALGNTALWAITGKDSITKWRGSHLCPVLGGVERPSILVLPTYHPAAVLRQWTLKPIFRQDLRRAATNLRNPTPKPTWFFTVRPTFAQVMIVLRNLLERAENEPLLLSTDIETRAQHTTCVGLAWTVTDALCIPFVSAEKPDGYWTEDQEVEIVWSLYRLLTHPRVQVVGQNFIYDAQYFYRHWHFIPNLVHDTMLAQHVCFPRVTKSLDFIASMYCEHYVYWKDDGKDWRGDGDEEQYWRYNCEDCVRTLECHHVLQRTIKSMGLTDQYAFQMRMWKPCLKMMIRGIPIDRDLQQSMKQELNDHASTCLREVNYMVGWEINPRSNPQMQRFFYAEMGCPKQYSRGKEKHVTCNDEALAVLGKREPIVRPITSRISQYRSCKTLVSNALKGAIGWDGAMHSSFNLAGTVSFRLSSATDAFGSGMNLENITAGDPDDPAQDEAA